MKKISYLLVTMQKYVIFAISNQSRES